MINLARELGFRVVYASATVGLTAIMTYLTYGPMQEYVAACGVRRNQARLCFATTAWAWAGKATSTAPVSETVARSWQDLAYVYASFSHEFPVAGCEWLASSLQLCPCLAHGLICGLALTRSGLTPSGWHTTLIVLGLGAIVIASLAPWACVGVVGFDTVTREYLDSELSYTRSPACSGG